MNVLNRQTLLSKSVAQAVGHLQATISALSDEPLVWLLPYQEVQRIGLQFVS